MKKILTILLVLVTVSGFAGKLNEGYDPTAARNDLSNVTPATGRTALDLYYTGNPTTGVSPASTTLAVNGAALSLAIASGSAGYIDAQVVGKISVADTLRYVRVHLTGDYEANNGTLALVGDLASVTTQLNAATYSAYLDVGDGVLKIIGQGDTGAVWTVKKLEVK